MGAEQGGALNPNLALDAAAIGGCRFGATLNMLGTEMEGAALGPSLLLFCELLP